MKQVYKAADLIEAQLLKDFISDHKIEVIIKGDLLTGAVGEIPADITPSVWVLNVDDYDAARELVTVFESNNKDAALTQSVWKCLECDELIEPQFSQCWKCGAARKI